MGKVFNDIFGEEEGPVQFEKVTVVKGGVKDEEAIKELVTGADVVLSFLGMIDRHVWVVEPGIKQIMSAMKSSGSTGKLVCLSAMGVRDSWYQTRASHWAFGPTTLVHTTTKMRINLQTKIEHIQRKNYKTLILQDTIIYHL